MEQGNQGSVGGIAQQELGGISGLMANLDFSKLDQNESYPDSFFDSNSNKQIMDQLDSQEEIKVGGLRLQDIDQFVADAEEELNRNSLLKAAPNLEDTMRVNYVEGAILDGNEKKQGEKDCKG